STAPDASLTTPAMPLAVVACADALAGRSNMDRITAQVPPARPTRSITSSWRTDGELGARCGRVLAATGVLSSKTPPSFCELSRSRTGGFRNEHPDHAVLTRG